MKSLGDTHVVRVAGFDLVGHLHFDEVSPAMSASTAACDLARVRELVAAISPRSGGIARQRGLPAAAGRSH